MPLWDKYEIACAWPGCAGKLVIEQAASAGLKLGDMVPEDMGNHKYGRCPRCKRCKMKVVKVPPQPEAGTPTGFSKIPTE